ncbi:uncharacterized protein NFIA_030580 [Aspergillus fischeri NRRL 181]|uniref:Mutanase n=1 Tax=Neosartorya fischeri (strain ATCC 1020 / DSM 3700 / CBS 544.65 / FGSC A1164 / JCM 1740 / NRRL 181 / WB 181) TaxID=331117 RepID=A1D9Z4_NEOFI|nr:conserved hypothetical protein [Aspergillus fischeri NRRL 181]EAW20625.1 conserved hypothetical protein [Aspergillus fischeri NRRL 181]
MNRFAVLAMVMAFQVIHQANAKAVFAHFMVTNSENYTASDWQSDIGLAQDAHIDAFALNMAWEDKTNDASVEMAFTAANAKGFKLFFSFDYAGNGPWDQDVVIRPGNAADWVTIKAKTNCFFMPDWSSVGAKPAVGLANGVADGLFSWSAWPWGNQGMDTYTDASYIQYLDGKPYMMAISPWFYTNLPGYNKNWLWNGGSLWFDRWQELFGLDPMPEFVEIISWNDYGESHYIGPIRENALAALDIGKAPYNYVSGYPHDAWRDMLPFLIDLYKTGSASMDNDIATFWYSPNPLDYCSAGGTTLNTASQLQIEFDPKDKLEARIWVMALFSDGNAAVYVNGHAVEWDSMPQTDVKGDGDIDAGIWFGSVAAPPGMVTVDLFVRDSSTSFLKTIDITTSCDGGFNNFNAWVGSVRGGWYGPSSTSVDLKDQVCVKGKGAYDFNPLCTFTCSYGYCPVGACTCEQMGVALTKPNATGTTGYPAEGKDANYKGLCSFACNYGYCPSGTCDTIPCRCQQSRTSCRQPALLALETAQSSDCVRPLVQPPAQSESAGMAAPGQPKKFDNLCDFTCSRGYCPPGTCISEAEQRITEAEQEITEAIATSGYNISDFADFNLTILGTALTGEDGCTTLQKKQIRSGWVESWKIMNYIYKVAKAGIDFNEAAAVEYLGPPSMNQDQWSNYKAIYLNLATIQPGWKILDPFDWFAWKIAVRCDDPGLQCSCGRDVNTIAYTVQKDPKHQVAAINFCPQYFSLQTLKDAMYWADTTHTPGEYADLNNYYNNQALVWIHELLHIDWVSMASSSGNIHHVSDIKVGYEEGNKGVMRYYTAYGPRMCKALARLGWATGKWTIQNADSLTLYAFAKYVQNALGNIYPHLPLAPPAPKSATIPFEIDDLFTLYNNGTGERVLNTTLDNKLEWSLSQGVCAAADDEDGDEAASAVMTTMTTWPVETDYPSDYLSSWSSWAGLTPTTTTTTTAAAATATAFGL